MNKKEKSIDKNIMIHYLRNPYSIDELEFCKIRLHAADELEKLYKLEEGVQALLVKIEKYEASLNE